MRKWNSESGLSLLTLGLENQGLSAAFADPLPQAASPHQIRGHLGIFPLLHNPDHHHVAPGVNHHVQVQPDSPHTGGQLGDVPISNHVGALGFLARHLPSLWGRLGMAMAVSLVMFMEQPIEAAL